MSNYARLQPVMDGDEEWDGKEDLTTPNGVVFHADNRVVTTIGRTSFRQWAYFKARKTRWDTRGGMGLSVLGWVEGEPRDGISKWWVGSTGSRIWSGHTEEK